jgi:hypothetical protein
MSEIALNILGPEEITQLKALLSEVVSTLPKQRRGCEVQALVAERLLKLAGAGEKDPIKLKERVLVSLRDI